MIAQMVADYFINKGYKTFANIAPRSWPGFLDDQYQDPCDAFARELKTRGFELIRCFWAPDLAPAELEDYEKSSEIIKKFFMALPRPAALFIANSLHLPLTYCVLEKLGIRVPEEIAVICNADDNFIAANAFIPTTSISGEIHEAGRKMAELMQRMLDGEDVPHRAVYVSPSAIVARQSTDALAIPNLTLASAIKFFLANHTNFISVADAADAAGVSSVMLNRLFQSYLGKSPGKFLWSLRMNHILQLLDNTDLPISEIAPQCGYSSDIALGLAFKREHGTTPGEYRRRRRQNATAPD